MKAQVLLPLVLLFGCADSKPPRKQGDFTPVTLQQMIGAAKFDAVDARVDVTRFPISNLQNEVTGAHPYSMVGVSGLCPTIAMSSIGAKQFLDREWRPGCRLGTIEQLLAMAADSAQYETYDAATGKTGPLRSPFFTVAIGTRNGKGFPSSAPFVAKEGDKYVLGVVDDVIGTKWEPDTNFVVVCPSE